ncbi:MAG: hypothetical protein NTV87_12695 [Ignavibacteriae bacterium]|nr:hypothetical protein [Ignavibacteriota bacterium]
MFFSSTSEKQSPDTGHVLRKQMNEQREAERQRSGTAEFFCFRALPESLFLSSS